MAKIFRFLEDFEMETLIETADHQTYQPEEFLINEGDPLSSLFIIDRGTVKVVREHVGFTVDLAEVGAGNIFGEMSFVEGRPASASVQAVDEVDAVIISNRHILGIIRDNPGFYGRFYHSLAEILSRRVRETTEKFTAGDTPWMEK